MSVITHSGETEEVKTAEVAADALDPLVGQTLDGRFRIVDVIGKGAMGKVYRAVQLPLNRAVALKVLDSRYGAGREESFKQRFLVEAALTAKLNHPNTVRVLDYGSTADGLFFIVMEYLDGETLEKLLSKGPLPWHRVLSIGQQMARALREAHELGVVHRDLKPANVVMLHADEDSDFVKVLDFGLVKSFVDGQELEGRAITQQGMLMGSPPYMAPEQGERNRADPRSDIYSLGTMLFEMLTGKPPFTGGGALEIILKHVHEPVPAIATPSNFERPPETFLAIVHKCLAKSPMDRFQSMDELLLALQDVSVPNRNETQELPKTEAAVPIVSAPEAVPAQALPPPTKGPTLILLVGFVVAAVAGVLGTWAVVRPTTPTKLSLHVESTPAGAAVIVDGKTLGVTPLELEQGLQGGRGAMELRLEKEGFAPFVLKLSAPAGRVELSPTLTPAVPEAARTPRTAAELARALEDARKLEAEEAKAATARLAEDAQAAEAAKKAEAARLAEEAKAAEAAKKAEATRLAEEAKAAEAAKKAEAARLAEEARAAKAAEAQRAAEAAKAARAAKAAEAARALEAAKAARAAKAAEAARAAEEARAAKLRAAEEARAARAARAAAKLEAAKTVKAEAAKTDPPKSEPPKTEPKPVEAAPEADPKAAAARAADLAFDSDAAPVKKAPAPSGPRPASKLDEEEDTSAPKSELKRPTAQP